MRVVLLEMRYHVELVWDWGLEMRQPTRNEPGGLLVVGDGRRCAFVQILMTQGEGKYRSTHPVAASLHRD